MKTRILVLAALATALATSALALSPEFLDWERGPAHYLMTKEESANLKSITTDDQAKAFVALFWARRDPTPDTPRNEFREMFEARVAWAEKNLAERMPGSMTDRGKIFILFGPPKRVEKSAPQTPSAEAVPRDMPQDQRDAGTWMQWVYEGDEAKDVFGLARATIRFVDRLGDQEYRLDRGRIDLEAAQQRAIERAITQPNLTAPPAFEAQAPVAAAPQPPPIQTELTTASLKAAVEAFVKGESTAEKKIYANWLEDVTSFGETYVPVLLYVPKDTGLTPADPLTFFGVVRDESGKNVLAFEEPASLAATKDDFYVDKSLALPGGKLHGIFGLAKDDQALAMAAADMELSGAIDKDATAISPLILSNNIFPLTAAQAATDPFAFGGVKVIPKGDKTFRRSDELWYFFELRNPGLAEPPPAGENVVPVNPVSPAPKIQVRIDVDGTDSEGQTVRMAQPLRQVETVEMKGVPGHYGVGTSIRLEKFKLGTYRFTAKVIDTMKKVSYNLTGTFRVVE